jgi:homoserine acetyltransferase
MATDDPAARWPHYREDDFIIRNFAFKSGEVLPELRLHYRTMGVPRRDASGTIVNGVLLLQGNTGTGANWLRPSLADALYGPGQPLDAHRYFLIMPDTIGRGRVEQAVRRPPGPLPALPLPRHGRSVPDATYKNQRAGKRLKKHFGMLATL